MSFSFAYVMCNRAAKGSHWISSVVPTRIPQIRLESRRHNANAVLITPRWASCSDIDYNDRRVVELLGPGRPFRYCVHQSPGHTFRVKPGRDSSATGN